MNKRLVKQWMSVPVITARPDTHSSDAKRTMRVKQIRALPIVENNKLVGIITLRGLLRNDLSGLAPDLGIVEENFKELTMREIMTTHVITIDENAPVAKAARSMMENKITALPVVNKQRELTGILTSSDLFRIVIEEISPLDEMIFVYEYMTPEVISIIRDTSILEAQRQMGVHRIRTLPVIENDKLIGIITRTDLMAADPSHVVIKGKQELSLHILNQNVEKIMRTPVITISAVSPITEAASRMLEKKIHSLPVAEGNKMIGIISETDLFRLIVKKFF